MDRLADEVANGTLRITTRQGIQYHFTHKASLASLIRTLNNNLITTLAACGDVVRNTMCCAAPYSDALHDEIHEQTQEIARRFRPKTGSYYGDVDRWRKGSECRTCSGTCRWASSGLVVEEVEEVEEVEPLYGPPTFLASSRSALPTPATTALTRTRKTFAAVA